MQKHLPNLHIIKAADLVGGLNALARELKVTGPTVHQWAKGQRPVPARFGLPIEQLTGEAVTRYDICPVVFGQRPSEPAQ